MYIIFGHKSCVLPGKIAEVSIKLSGFSIKTSFCKVESIKPTGQSIKNLVFVELIAAFALAPLAHGLDVFMVRIDNQQPFAQPFGDV